MGSHRYLLSLYLVLPLALALAWPSGGVVKVVADNILIHHPHPTARHSATSP